MPSEVQLSAIIPVLQRTSDFVALFQGYDRALHSLGRTYEIIFVVDGGNRSASEAIARATGDSDNVKIVLLAKHFGEATALSAGFDVAKGDLLLTLPAYHQVEPDSLTSLVDALPGYDMVIARRWPRAGGMFERIRRRTFHTLLKLLSGEQYQDLGCGVRLFKRQLVEEIHLYGDQHRFFPVLAGRQGFKVREVDVRQSPLDVNKGRYRLREYLHRLLDIVTIFFLVRFTKKPLRFFGMIGSIVSAFGAIVVFTLVVQRLFFGVALADRPALLLGSLLLVLGVQVFALGLIGELIIFTHAGSLKEYAVAEIFQQTDRAESGKEK
jgi:glycosyltransferase involved in cell wall biosynthesis